MGPEGKAGNYPEELKVGEEGRAILGIVNHEQERASYRVEAGIRRERAKLRIEGEERGEIKVELEPEQAWGKAVGFVPQKTGENQKVEFVLYKDGEPYFEDQLYLWVEVEEV